MMEVAFIALWYFPQFLLVLKLSLQKPDDLQTIRHEIDPNLHRSRDRILPWRIRKNFDNFSILNIFEIVTKCNKYINKLENM